MAADLVEYVATHTERGECNCGNCFDRGVNPDPTGHCANLIFFKVAARGDGPEPSLDTFRQLSQEHSGEFADCDPFDGKEHSYLELGGWIGDQGAALQYMGLGALLGAFNLLTPASMGLPEDLWMQMASVGYVVVQARTVTTH